jgi:hypothetical protein
MPRIAGEHLSDQRFGPAGLAALRAGGRLDQKSLGRLVVRPPGCSGERS